MFFSKSFIMFHLAFRSSIHFEFTFLYGVRECSKFHFSTCSCQVFSASFIEEIVFSPLYILISFIID